MIINYLKNMAWSLGIILVSAIILTILNYFNILTGIPLKVIELIIPIIAIFIGSYKTGKVSKEKGYIEGLKYGLLWIIIFTIINLFMKNMHFTNAIYFLLILLISMGASMIGINRKRG